MKTQLTHKVSRSKNTVEKRWSSMPKKIVILLSALKSVGSAVKN